MYTATSTGKKKKERKRNGETQNKDRTRFTERVQKTPLNPTMGHQRSEGTKSEIKYLNRSRGRPTQWVALDCFVKKNIWIWEVYYQLRAAAVFVFWGNLSFWSVALLKLNLTVFSRLNICADWLRLAHSWDIQRRPIDQKTRWNGMRFETILIWV